MANEKNYQSASDYILESVKVENDGGDIVNIRNHVVELNIYENLERPYLTGDMMIKDDFGFYDQFGLTGTERCTIVISQPNTSGFGISKTFIISSVLATKKVNDYSEIITLKLIEKIGFDNQLLKFSKSYAGGPISIIENILNDKLGTKIDLPRILPVQSDKMKVVIPFMTPLEACKWITNRSSTEVGMPFYFYRTLINDNFQFKSLEEMILDGSWNAGMPFRFSQALTNFRSNPADIINSFVVERYSASNKENTLQQIDNGAVSAAYTIFDATSGRYEKFSYNVNNLFKDLYKKNIFNKTDYPVLSSSYKYNDIGISSYPSKVVTRVVMNNTLGSNYKNYYEEEQTSEYKLDAVNRAIKSMILKSSINITVPGKLFFDKSNRTIGRQIELFYHSNNVAKLDAGNTIDEETSKDKRRSGNYVIYAARHNFLDTKHTVDLSAVKLGNEQ